jgi:hypothetical protein
MNLPWDQMTRISIWELTRFFRVKILGAENVRWEKDDLWVYIQAGLYHGGELVAPLIHTKRVPARYPFIKNFIILIFYLVRVHDGMNGFLLDYTCVIFLEYFLVLLLFIGIGHSNLLYIVCGIE